MKTVKHLPKNKLGKDFIVGDLHGCYEELMAELNRVNFNKSKDRLFSVGDLTDRGPYNTKVAELIYEPWFFAVQGNHDRMFFTCVLGDASIYHNGNSFIANGGKWIYNPELTKEYLKTLARDMKARMPIAFNVGGKNGFIVTHAKMTFDIKELGTLDIDDDFPCIDEFVWDRSIYNDISNGIKNTYLQIEDLKQIRDQHILCDEFDPSRKIVYVGHNTMSNNNIFYVNNHVNLDTGACYNYRGKTGFKLTLVEHEETLKRYKDG